MEKQALLSDTGPHDHYGSMSPESLPASAAAAFPEASPDEEWASAPPADMLDDVVGYEGIAAGGEGSYVLPPISIAEGAPRYEPSPQRAWSIPTVTEDMAREAFIQFASSKCCYSTRPAREMVFRDLRAYNTYRYRLESFTESRSTEWKMVPYKGQFVDSNAYGIAPLPWDIIVERPPMFQDDIRKVPVPHTSSVKGCSACMALGNKACIKCTATGMVKCFGCNGRGYQLSDDTCIRCNGTGLQRCGMCCGQGSKPCQKCKGRGQLMVFIQLTVKWQNNIAEGIADRQSGLPLEIYSKITGQNIYTDQQPRVYPIVAFPDHQVNQASQKAIREHEAQLVRTSHIIQQRQTVEFIPVTQVQYKWKEEEYIYFTCGSENRVYAPDYPAKCCCCSIL
ncbi:protein SSUH2 homolog [Carcharodon carcharias]|uniref:protein SSUH2 homolog n=1 Tax=Carcharodon carcharias TaxID=13397 RepID=UPI001B7DE164|nr:protein SSUH2 homolog [Carcharodon carcharias]